ncbi:hypothetical protein [uncultured Gammaproteobacteria bacterium]|nr:hypothetical protein [uncultured Gammaproteobacteria bacterium]
MNKTLTNNDWANAIATRISDEWIFNEDFVEDKNLIKKIWE